MKYTGIYYESFNRASHRSTVGELDICYNKTVTKIVTTSDMNVFVIYFEDESVVIVPLHRVIKIEALEL